MIDPRVTVVRLRRNFGQTGALAAGFAHSTGDYVIAMDGDLQHDPAEIPGFLKKIEEGYDIVSGLLQTMEEETEMLPDGSRTVHVDSAPDSDGRRQPIRREIAETKKISPGSSVGLAIGARP
jgi:glycosyltransferase involved in cell wall biosynthesis